MIIDLIEEITNIKTGEVLQGGKVTQLHIELPKKSLQGGTWKITKTKKSTLWPQNVITQ